MMVLKKIQYYLKIIYFPDKKKIKYYLAYRCYPSYYLYLRHKLITYHDQWIPGLVEGVAPGLCSDNHLSGSSE